MARSDDAPSSPPEPPGLLRRTTTPTNSPWLYRLLSPFVASSSPTTGGGGSSSSSGKAKAMAKAALGIGSSTNSPSQVDEGYESEDDPARHFDLLTAFPIEISLTILAFLPASDLARLSAVSHAWAALLADDLTWKTKFEAVPGWQLRPSYLASLGSAPGPADPTSLPSSPTQLLSSLSLSSPHWPTAGPLPSSTTTDPLALPLYKALYAKRLWVARRFGRNNPYRSSSSAESLAAELVVSERELSGHDDSIYALAFDGAKVLTGSRDRSIKLWDIESGQLIGTVEGAHQASVLCIAFEEAGPEEGGMGALAVSGGSDGVVALWALGGPGLPKGPLVKISILTGHTQGVLDVAINADYIVSCSKDTTILVHTRSAPHALLYRLDLHTGPVNALSLDGHLLASASGDGRVRLWDLRTGAFVRRLKGHERGLACVSLKEGWVVSGSNDQSIKVWNADTGECIRTLKGHTDLVRSLDFTPSAGVIVSGGYDKKIMVWSLKTGALLRTLESSHTSHVFDLALDGSKIVSAGHDKRAFVYDFGDGETGRLFV